MDSGIDISHWNRVNNWHAVRSNNITFVSVKTTDGVSHVDEAANDHLIRARDVGILVGGYHFARDASPRLQADHFVTQLRQLRLLGGGCLEPMLGMQDKSGIRDRANEFVEEFIAEYRRLSGRRRILVFANLDWFLRDLEPNRWADKDVHLWVAGYHAGPGLPGFAHSRLALHQHTDEGHVPGIPGHVHRNVTMKPFTLGDLLLANTLPGSHPPVSRYTVRAGDNLTKIAGRFRTTVSDLVRLNHIPDPNGIHIGQTLRVR